MSGSQTFFTSASGGGSGTSDYIRDVFDDVSLPATNNSGLTDSASTNPQGRLFANDNAPRFGAKTIYIKDLVLESDRSKWIGNRNTYRVIPTEANPNLNLYIFGDIQICANQAEVIPSGPPFNIDAKVVEIKNIGGGIGVNGVIRRAAFLVDNYSGTGTAQVVTDGVVGNTITFGSLAANADTSLQTRFSAFVHASSNETNDLHDIRLTALQAGTLRIVGIIVLFENSGQNVAVAAGSSYVDKTKLTTTSGATAAIPAMGSSLGGQVLIYNSVSGVQVGARSFTSCITIGQGSSGTNLMSVSTGHGSSFPVGSGVIAASGASVYTGSVINVSTDTLTVSPTMTVGVSATLFRSWLSSPTLTIGSSFFTLYKTIEFENRDSLLVGATGILSLSNSYNFWSSNTGFTQSNNIYGLNFLGASGFLQVDGDFSAAEVEFQSSGALLHATFMVNGCPGWGTNEGVTGAIRRTVFSEAGSGWNSFVMKPGASMGSALSISRINLYQRSEIKSVTYGMLGAFNVNQPMTHRSASNATMMAFGVARRLYADQLYLSGSWVRGITTTTAGGAFYYGSSTNSTLRVEYYGKEFAVLGTPGGGTLTLNGTGIGLTFGLMRSVATLGFHTVQYTVGSGSTAILEGFDFASPYGEMQNKQNMIKSAESAAVDARKVLAVYVGTTGQATFGDGTTSSLNYDLRHIDTHHAVKTGPGGSFKFCAPRTSDYDISAGWADSIGAGNTVIKAILMVRGRALYEQVNAGLTESNFTVIAVQGNWKTRLFAGDEVTVVAFGKNANGNGHTPVAGNTTGIGFFQYFSVAER